MMPWVVVVSGAWFPELGQGTSEKQGDWSGDEMSGMISSFFLEKNLFKYKHIS